MAFCFNALKAVCKRSDFAHGSCVLPLYRLTRINWRFPISFMQVGCNNAYVSCIFIWMVDGEGRGMELIGYNEEDCLTRNP